LEVESVAVAFINSYANPAHEARCGAILGALLGPAVEITLSSSVTRLWLEYERTSSTAINARLAPIARRTFRHLEDGLEEMRVRGARRAMKSNGGVTSFDRASRLPVYLTESGPAGGVIGALSLSRVAGIPNLITFDVGGTTAKCSLI